MNCAAPHCSFYDIPFATIEYQEDGECDTILVYRSPIQGSKYFKRNYNNTKKQESTAKIISKCN